MELSPTTSRTAETRNPGSGISGARFTTARSFLGRTRTKNLDKMVTELRQRKQSVSDSRLQAKATKILHRNNAQEILQALATLEEHRAEFATRWLWELIQNARDFPDDSRPMTIRISVVLLMVLPFAFRDHANTFIS
jgi:hypothetical protein